MRILVVENDPMTRDAAQTMLEELGFSVFCVDTVAQATVRLQEHFTHLLCDLCLSDGDGVEVIRYAKRMNADIRVVAFTGSIPSSLHGRTYAAGADMVLMKPVGLPQLMSALLPIQAPASSLGFAFRRTLAAVEKLSVPLTARIEAPSLGVVA